MPLGGDYSTNEKKYREVEVYSPYKMSNTEGVDPSALSFSFFRDCLKITISPMFQNARPGDSKKWDTENAITIYVQHTKARMLAAIIQDVLDPEKPDIVNGGIQSGPDGFISFSNGKELGCDNYCLILRKMDNVTGEILTTYAYEFKTNYHYAIINFDQSTSAHKKVYFDNIEIEQFLDLLKQYYTSMTYATSYSVNNQMRFEMSRLNTKLNNISEALGISYEPKNANYNNKNNNRSSFFNNTNSENGRNSINSQPTESSLDRLEGRMNPPED